MRFVAQLSYEDFLNLLTLCDVMLDSLHFGGGNSTYEALAMRLPIVTLPSDSMRGRVTLGCYQAMQIMDLVATDKEDYVRLAIKTASEKPGAPSCSNASKTHGQAFSNRCRDRTRWRISLRRPCGLPKAATGIEPAIPWLGTPDPMAKLAIKKPLLRR